MQAISQSTLPPRTQCRLQGSGMKAFIMRCSTRPLTFSSAATTNIMFVGLIALSHGPILLGAGPTDQEEAAVKKAPRG